MSAHSWQWHANANPTRNPEGSDVRDAFRERYDFPLLTIAPISAGRRWLAAFWPWGRSPNLGFQWQIDPRPEGCRSPHPTHVSSKFRLSIDQSAIVPSEHNASGTTGVN